MKGGGGWRGVGGGVLGLVSVGRVGAEGVWRIRWSGSGERVRRVVVEVCGALRKGS